MRVQKYVLNEYVTLPPGMGFPVPTSALVPAPPLPLFRGLGAFGGAWEDWCDKNYWTAENNGKCKACPVKDPVFQKCLSGAPWTTVGRAVRGLPSQTDLERLGPSGAETPAPDPGVPVPSDESWFEKNKMLVIAGGGALALGLVALGMRKKGGRGLFGLGGTHYKRRKNRRSR